MVLSLGPKLGPMVLRLSFFSKGSLSLVGYKERWCSALAEVEHLGELSVHA